MVLIMASMRYVNVTESRHKRDLPLLIQFDWSIRVAFQCYARHSIPLVTSDISYTQTTIRTASNG